MHPDSVRLAWLEMMARHKGLFLCNGVDSEQERRTAPGLGLRPGFMDRTLRQAIDTAMDPGWMPAGYVPNVLPDQAIRVDDSGNVIDP